MINPYYSTLKTVLVCDGLVALHEDANWSWDNYAVNKEQWSAVEGRAISTQIDYTSNANFIKKKKSYVGLRIAREVIDTLIKTN